MLIETLSVREARERLPNLLARFRRGERTSVGIGAHRKTEAVLVPVEVFEEFIAKRAQSLREATASVQAEGLTISAGGKAIAERWAQGEINTEQMHELILRLHGVQ